MMKLLISSSLLFGCGCAAVQRPNTILYGVNGSAGRLEGYNLKSDYADDGSRNSGATPTYKPVTSLKQMNGALCVLPANGSDQGSLGLKQWIADTRAWAQEHCQQ